MKPDLPPPVLCYLDNNATTRVAPEVVAALLPVLTEYWGNPSSAYGVGREAARQIETARASLAEWIQAEPREILFTSCGTESINSAIHSALHTRPDKRHIVTTMVEHSATLRFCCHLQQQGYAVTFLPVNSQGALDLEELERAIRPDTALVTVMWANNETGVLFPIADIAAVCRRKGVLCHTDAVQVAGKLAIDVKQLGVDFLSLSAHKLYAPKGTGLLYVKRHTRFQPYLIGGGQERGRRGGTENVANVVAFGCAAQLTMTQWQGAAKRLGMLRDQLETGVLSCIPGTSVNGASQARLPNTTNIAFEGVEAEGLLLLLDQAGICASSGSACTAGSLDPSHVLIAMGCSAARARASVRFSLGIYNTEAEVEYVLQQLPLMVEKLRSLSTSR